MADLKARFSLVDDMSERLSQIGDSGLSMIEAWEQAGEAASSAIDGVASSATQTATAVDGVAHSIDEVNSSVGGAEGAAENFTAALENIDSSVNDFETAADSLNSTLNDMGNATEEAAAGADRWTAAVGNYDKSALEFIYTTEELVELGYKTAETFEDNAEAMQRCEEANQNMAETLSSSASTQEELNSTIEKSNELLHELSEKNNLSEEATQAFEKASQAASEALEELNTSTEKAEAAVAALDSLFENGESDLTAYETAIAAVEEATKQLAEANEKASKATEELSDASQKAGESAEEAGEKGTEAAETLYKTLASIGIIKLLDDMADKAYELADAFSESQKIIVNATGATGENLEGLEQSMMNAYSNNKQSLDTTAAAVGEINTRMGLQGNILTDVTGKFLDYSNVTGTNVVNSVANVTKIMNKWNIEQEQCESVMDKLVYASQISGASVDSLSSTLINSSGAFQQLDLSLDNSISLLASLELYGINSSTAVMAMRTAVKNFSQDGEDAGIALRKVIDEIANMESTTEATARACEVFGTRAGVEMASAIRNGAISVETLDGDLSKAEGTLKKTAEAGETLSEKWEKSNNKLKTAFSSALQPALDKASAALAKVVGNIGDFLIKHPYFTKALTAIGIGLGVVAVALAGYTAATTLATAATTAFAAVLNMTPLGWVATAIAGVTAAGIALAAMFSKDKEEVEDYNGTMVECQAELQRTEAAYERAVDLYGENSAAAKDLSESVETLNKQFEKGGGIAGVYAEQAAKLSDSFDELSSSQRKAIEEIDKTETSGLTAVAMLSALSEQSNHTNADLDLMAEYADYLNDTFNCDIKVNYDTGELTGFDPTSVIDEIMNMAHDQRYQKAMEYLSAPDFMDTYTEAKKQIHDLGIQIDQLEMLRDNAENAPASSYGSTWGKEQQDQLDSLTDSYNTYMDVLEQCEVEIEEYGAVIDETGEFNENYKKTLDNIAYGLDSVTQYATGAKDATLTYDEAAAYAYENVRQEIEELCEAYDEAYQTAYDSFTGQFSLFEQASTTSETYLNSTVANAQAALETQLNYWTTYGENIEKLKEKSASDLSLTQEQYDALMSYVQSGSEEAAGLAASMVAELDKGNTDAVTKLGETLSNVTSKQDEIAKSVADWKTNFSTEMDAILQKASETVKNLDMSEEARQSAYLTLYNYTEQLKRSGNAAVAEAQSIANRISAALSSANAKINVNVSGNVPGHATGTTNAEDIFVAGENGPELIVGKAGSTVFPTSETNKIISALEGVGGNTEVNRTSYTTATTANTSNDYSRAIENYDQREDITEINNNSYTTIENGSDYDDGRIITILTGFLDVFSALEKKMDTKSKVEMPELNVYDAYEHGSTASDDTFIAGEKGPELVVGQADSIVFPTEETDRIIKAIGAYGAVEPYDFTALEKSLSRNNSDITNFDESVSYGDSYSVNNIRNYSNEYSEIANKISNAEAEYNNSVDRSYAETVNYGDSVRSFEESVNGGDSSYNTVTSYDNERSYTASTDTAYGDTFDNDVNYGAVIRNVAEEISSSNDRSYAETVNYGDSFRSFIENVAGAKEERYNSSNSINSSSAKSYYSTNGGNNVNSSTDYGDSVRNYVESVLSNKESKLYSNSDYATYNSRDFEAVTGPTIRNALSYENGYNRSIQNIANSENNSSNSHENSLQNSEITTYQNASSPGYQTDNIFSNYNNSSESVQNASEAVSSISKATSLINNAESHSDSVSVLSEAIRNNSAENNRYENTLTTLGNEISNTSTQTEQAIQNMENLTSGNTFNNSENNVERMEQSIANDNRDYEAAESTNNISRQAYYNTANTYGRAEYIDSRENSAAYQSDDRRVYGDTATYGDSIKNFESSYINTENTPQAFENRTESVFIPIIGIISAMIERAFRGNLSAVEASGETAYSFGTETDSEPEYVIDIPEIPERDNDNRIVAERGVDRKDINGERDTDSDSGAGTESVKRIVLEIAGSGSIDISDGVDEDKVLELIEDNIKPVLMNIIQSEIYEEGEASYDF